MKHTKCMGLLLLVVTGAFAQEESPSQSLKPSGFYTWTDEQGITHFSDLKPNHVDPDKIKNEAYTASEVNVINPPKIELPETPPEDKSQRQQIFVIGDSSKKDTPSKTEQDLPTLDGAMGEQVNQLLTQCEGKQGVDLQTCLLGLFSQGAGQK